jgi:glutamate-ammonia-ligase adenylyltransferase
VVYYTRLTQRLVAALTVPTRRGLLYEVDLRLRPQGGKGPVASQFRGFVSYQQNEADLWEHMALTRARIMAGDDEFCGRVQEAVARIVGMERDVAKVNREVRAMRELIAKEKGDDDPWDLKLARGGLTDLDFIAQALILAHAHAHPTLIGLAAEAVFAEARRLGFLSDGDARTLIETHQLFNAVFQWQRLTIEGAFDSTTVPPSILKRLADIAGLPNAQILLTQLNEDRGRVNKIYRSALSMP